MLFEFHFAEHAFALKLFLQGPKGLFDVIIADADLHVVVVKMVSLLKPPFTGDIVYP